jgi:hypothetical protein
MMMMKEEDSSSAKKNVQLQTMDVWMNSVKSWTSSKTTSR